MPRGKGTYGSKVGRPPKKQNKYQTGGEVLEASQMGQELKSIPLEGIEPDYPIADASERSENYQLGGAVKPPTSPSMPQYKKGGKVDKITKAKKDVIKSAGRRSKFYVKPEKQYFKGKEMKPVPMPSPKPSKQKAVPLPEPKLSDKEWALRYGLKMGKKKKGKKK
tara:strand:+ start:104 stop:598 length:495 start_codon:yes stop_codon:yes gene_type:complete